MEELSEETMKMNHREEEANDTTTMHLLEEMIHDTNHRIEKKVDTITMINHLDPPIAETRSMASTIQDKKAKVSTNLLEKPMTFPKVANHKPATAFTTFAIMSKKVI